VPNLVNQETPKRFIALRNPIVEKAVRMRPSLIPGLLNSLRHNFNHGEKDVKLFEIGRIFASQRAGELPNEFEALAFVVSGGAQEANRAQASRDIDFGDAKGALEAAVDSMRQGSLEFESGQVKHLRTGQSAAIKLNGAVIGSLGRLSEAIAAAYKFRQAVYVGELNLTALLAAEEKPVLYQPLARFPSVVRDATFTIPRHVSLASLLKEVGAELLEYCRKVEFVRAYEGPPIETIPEGWRSITLRFEYRSDDRTLDDEVTVRHLAFADAVREKYGYGFTVLGSKLSL
jgi:phenylalanyl-tRNA synthetase beta chain